MIETSQATFTFGALPSGVRDYNERLLLTMIRRLGPVAASDLARLSTLSAQTVSVILRKLESLAAVPGKNLHLTLDSRLQKIAEQALGEENDDDGLLY